MTAKGSRDAFLGVAKSRVQSFFAVVLCMAGQAASGSCFDRDGAF